MGAWLGTLFGTKQAVENILNKDSGLLKQFGGWIDDFNYTAEERSVANAEKREWGIRQLEALAPFKVVQRILAFAATGLWGFVGLNVIAAIWVDSIYGTGVTESMLAFALSDYVVYPVMICFSLYFSGGVIESFKKKGE